MATLFKIDENEIEERLFSGKPTVLKSNATVEVVEQFKKAIQSAGANCSIIPVNRDSEIQNEKADSMTHPQRENVTQQTSEIELIKLLTKQNNLLKEQNNLLKERDKILRDLQ